MIFEFDLLIVLSSTIVVGLTLRKFIFNKSGTSKYGQWVPFAFAFFIIATIYPFVTNELPLRCFSFDSVVDHPSANESGPQSPSGGALVAVAIYLFTVTLNIVVWLIALIVIIKYFLRIKQERQNSTIASP